MESISNIYCLTCFISDIKQVTPAYKKQYGLKWNGKFYETKDCSECNLFKRLTGKNVNTVFSGDPKSDRYIGPIPKELENLSFGEKAIISLILPVVTVSRKRGPQNHYLNHVISFKQQIKSYTKHLPRLAEECNLIIFEKDGIHKELHVNRERVENALNWLKENNPFYKDIEISKTRLQNIPDNG